MGKPQTLPHPVRNKRFFIAANAATANPASFMHRAAMKPQHTHTHPCAPLAVVAKRAAVGVRVQRVAHTKALGHRLLPGVLATQAHGVTREAVVGVA